VSRRLCLVVNPAARGGKGLRVLPDVHAELSSLGAEHRVVEPSSLSDARAAARLAAADGETVAALGGDGLVGPLAGELRDADGALAVIPTGRGNDFARVLGIPREPRAAARVAATGRERRVDVAELDGRSFVGIASYGFDSEVQDVANSTRLVRGELVYVYAMIRALIGWRHATFRVSVDGERHEVTGYAVVVANSGWYGGGMRAVPHADLEDGKLDVALSARSPKLHYLRLLPKVFKGTHVDDPAFTFLRGEVVELDADRPFQVYADGDPIGALPATVRISRRALRVVVPA
jgi:YegS/Rv2252/BmrU family lipid kinase